MIAEVAPGYWEDALSVLVMGLLLSLLSAILSHILLASNSLASSSGDTGVVGLRPSRGGVWDFERLLFGGTMTIDKEFVLLLVDYVRREKTVQDLADWIAKFDWDNQDPETSFEAATAGHFHLLSCNVLEDIEPEEELRPAVLSLLASLRDTPTVQTLLMDKTVQTAISLQVYNFASGTDTEVEGEIQTGHGEGLDWSVSIADTSEPQPSLAHG